MPTELNIVFGTGPVGRAVTQELVNRGKKVRVVNRSGKADVPNGVEIMKGDVTDHAFAREASKGASVVYQCTNPPYTQWAELFPALQAGVLEGAASAEAKLIVMDNLYMYGPTAGKPLTEDLPDKATSRKGLTRAKMAQDIMAAHRSGKVRAAIGRASDYFGPGAMDSAAGDRLFLAALAGKAAQVIGNPDLPHTYSYVPDIGKALVTLGEREEALGQIWHLPAPETVTTREFVNRVYQETGHTPRLQVANKFILRAMGLFVPPLRELVEMYYEFNESFIMSHDKFAKAFGADVTPLQEAIHATVAWFRDHAEHTKVA
ncbi:MAG: epimerase [Chloroflexota bacterium]|nr:NAD-dependent epimerase/dehydratase family protein [Chloroflexota bacterium]NOG63543.1 NAD-dependent epimerase/dehydratase family protein [Chloroflexota bacterium]GIK62746.1 MAG: epimerase [Chloroflexota bacterium]